MVLPNQTILLLYWKTYLQSFEVSPITVHVLSGFRTIALAENCSNPNLTLALTQTLFPIGSGGQFSSGAIVRAPFWVYLEPDYLSFFKFENDNTSLNKWVISSSKIIIFF